jgi:hypothetical protein
MMDQLLAGLGLAAVSAITYVAYKHPAGYRRMLLPALKASVAIFWLVMI